ncbi:MAG: class I SAM-dependent methyltransferase [Coriobacteriia bacterium]|nr:class I SAM-dependent methyltransferase [Coriobacteriia bacterium]
MNSELAKKLCDINNRFYRDNCQSFSATRVSPWTGWKISLETLERTGLLDAEKLTVFDMACGNLRFASFLGEELPDKELTVFAVDDCATLVPQRADVCFQNIDVVDLLLAGTAVRERIDAPACDLSVCFGFMHHIPGQDNRKRLLESLLQQTRSGGYVVVSFWKFFDNVALAKKARLTHAKALDELDLDDAEISELDAGDCFLGWKDTVGSYRYCHSFAPAEIDELLASVADRASVVDRFIADGRTNDLNEYVILKAD